MSSDRTANAARLQSRMQPPKVVLELDSTLEIKRLNTHEWHLDNPSPCPHASPLLSISSPLNVITIIFHPVYTMHTLSHLASSHTASSNIAHILLSFWSLSHSSVDSNLSVLHNELLRPAQACPMLLQQELIYTLAQVPPPIPHHSHTVLFMLNIHKKVLANAA